MKNDVVRFTSFEDVGTCYCEEICSHETGDCIRCKVPLFAKDIEEHLTLRPHPGPRSDTCLLVLSAVSSVLCIASMVLLVIRLVMGGF